MLQLATLEPKVIEGSQVVLGSGGDDDEFLLLGLELVHLKVVYNSTR